MTKMEAPYDELMDQTQPPMTAIIADVELLWAIPAAQRRNIPVASLWTASASFYAAKCEKLKMGLLGEHKSEQTGEIGELDDPRLARLSMECVAMVSKANFLLLSSVYELELEAIYSLRGEYSFSVYPIGPAIPYLELGTCNQGLDYLKWLDSQPKESVLYISLGSFLSVASTQMDKFAAGLRTSRVRFLWVARGESARFKERCGDMGLVVPWCEQLKVLSHASVGGFWTHCGWNSTLEAMYSGVPMLTSPLAFDQFANSKRIVEDWSCDG